jgi:exodeoxyribonuclease VII small subunit
MPPEEVRNGSAARPRDALPDVASLTFEQALKELEAIVGRIERGDVELEQSIALYERGEALRAHCEALLQRIDARVERITLASNGSPAGVEPLDPQD